MNIANLFSALLPSYEAVQLKSILKKSADGISTELLPRYLQLQEFLQTQQGKSFNDKDVKAYSENLVKYLSKTQLHHTHLSNPTMLEYIIPALQNVGALASFLSRTIDKDMGRSVSTSVLSFNKATILRFVDIIDFAGNYAATLLNWITARELASVTQTNIAPKAISPGDLEMVQGQAVVFGIAMRILGTPINRLQADYAEIPEAVFDPESYQDLLHSFGESKVDPVGFSAVPFPLSIVLRIQLWRAEKQMDAYEECVRAGKSAEMRVLLMRKQMAEGAGDAAAEKLLGAYEKQYEELKYERARLESKYKLTGE